MIDIEKDMLSMMPSEPKALRVSGSRQRNWLLQIQSWIIKLKSQILQRQAEGSSHHGVAEEGGVQIRQVGKWAKDPRAADLFKI